MHIERSVFVVTGAGNGIGRCVALELIARGAFVVGADRDEQALTATAALVTDRERFTSHPIDICDRAAVAAFPASVIASHGQIDGLFNIAGIAQELQPVADLSDARIETLMQVPNIDEGTAQAVLDSARAVVAERQPSDNAPESETS